MKKTLERLKRLAAPSAHLVALLLATLAAGGAWAVTANVVWESDFGTTVKTGLDGKTYTLSLPDASWLQGNGTIKIGSDDNSQGATIVVTGGVQGEKVSILMEYADATAQSAVVPVYVDAGAWLGSQTKDSSLEVTGHWWNGGGAAYPTSGDTVTTMPKDGYFMYIFAQGDNVEIYSAETLAGMSDASAGGAVSGLNTANRVVSQIALGGVMIGGNGASLTSRPVNEFTGLVIKRVAIFTSKISASEAAAYKFPSEGTKVTVTEANTSWETAFPSWDDSADNSDKTLYIEIQEGASLSKDTALSVNGLFVTGAGSLTLSGAVTASSGITIGSGATVSLSDNTGSAITNYGTLNVNGCSVTGTINNYGTIATSGTTSIQNASSQFYESGTLSVYGETTLRTANDTTNDAGGLRGRIVINEDAKLISEYSATPNYSASLTFDLYGELALGSGVRWVVGGSTTVNVYSGGSITGGDTTNGGLDWRAGGGAINAYATSTFTAGIRARNGQTITVNVVGSDVVFSAPIYDGGARGTITKTGAGTWKIENGTSSGKDIKNALAGSSGTVEIIAKSADYNFASKGSTFSGVLKLTNANNKQTRFDAAENSVCFAEGVRPELVMDSTATYFRAGAYNNTPLYVRDLSGKSGAVFDARYTSGPLTFILDTQQTKDTEYAGIFNSDGTRTFSLNVTGNNVDGVHTLTLSGVNTTTNTVTVSNYAKVKFSSNGKWANGIVVVGENGVLESQNSAAIAAKLKVEEGATLAFANGVQLAATAFDWSAVSNEGSVNIDLSDITPSATPVTLIASGVTVTDDKFTVSDSQCLATLSVDNGALKATFANYWRDGSWSGGTVANEDAALYISQDSTLSLSEALSLGAVTVVKEGEGNVELTISGDGALTTGGWTIPEGVTVNTPASMSISGTVSGGGVLNIPANTTLAMDGVTCSAKVTVNGTLETSGTAMFSNDNNFVAPNGLLDVVRGTTTFHAPYTRGSATDSSFKGICGNLTVETDATFTIAGYDFNNFDPFSTGVLDISGTLNMGSRQWQFSTGVTINLHEGATINGDGDGIYGDWGFILGANTVNVDGNATIAASIFPKNTTFDIAENATLTISGAIVGSDATLLKSGLGVMDLTAITPSKPMTINAGTVVAVTAPTTVVVNESGVFELTSTANVNDANYGSGATSADLSGITGTGTLKYSSTAGWRAFPTADDHMPASTLTLQMELADSLIISKNNGETVVGSLAGSKNIRSDFGSNGGNGRILTVTQSKDTEWQGKFVANRLTKFNVVAPVEGTPGTLTLSGTQELSSYDVTTIPMQIDGSVNLTGTWIGDTTVDGTFGGTGSLTGALTFNAGSTFKVWETDADGLVATGALTLPVSGKVTVDVSDLTLGANDSYPLLTVGSGLSNTSAFADLDSETHMLSVSSGTLYVVPIAATVTSGLSVTKCSSVDAAIGTMVMGRDKDAYVTVLRGKTTYTAEQLAQYNVVYDSSDSTYRIAAAKISDTLYATIADALGEATSGNTIILCKNLTANVVLPSGVALNLNGCTLTGTVTTVDGYVVGTTTVAGATIYTSCANTSPETWVGESGGAWDTASNWSLGYVPLATTPVIFNDGASVTLNASATVLVAGVAVNGAVAISGSGSELKTSGNVTGTGTLTLSDVCLSSDGAGITVAPNIHFTNDSELAGDNVMTINGNVQISGAFLIWGANHIVAGSVQIDAAANFNRNTSCNKWLTINGAATVKGAFTAGASHLKFNNNLIIEDGSVTVDGSNINVDSSAISVVLAGVGASLYDSRGTPIAEDKVLISASLDYHEKVVSDNKRTFSVRKLADRESIDLGTGDEDVVVVVDGVTSIDVSGESDKVAIPGTVKQITGVTAAKLLLKVTYNETTDYYSGILSLDGSGNVSLNGAATVTVGLDTIKVQPEPATDADMTIATVSESEKQSLTVKTIPGLWYSLWSSDTVSDTVSGTALGGAINKPAEPIQATSAETVVNNGAVVGSGVRYYKVVVGATAADLQ